MLKPMSFLKKQSEKLLNIDESETLKAIDGAVEKGNQLLDDIQKEHTKEPITINQFLADIAPSIDEKIKKYCQRHHVQSLGGELSFKEDTKDKIHIQYDCYYKDMTGKIIKTSSEKRLDKTIFTAEAVEEIIKTNPIYPIEP